MSDEVRVVIAGSRTFKDHDFLVESCHSILVPRYEEHVLEFVSGGALGADRRGEKYAREFWGVRPKVFKPDYDAYAAKIAPLIRNSEMAKYARGGILIAFLGNAVGHPYEGGDWRIKGGTSNMIMNAINNEMDIHIFRFDEDE